MNIKTTIITGIVVAAVATLKSALFIVDEGQQAIITQFGRPIGRTIDQAGPHFKVPFVQEARYVERRILSWDGSPNQIPTKDKKFIKVDTTARWKIVDPLKFIRVVKNEYGAKERLDSILDSATRDIISQHRLVETVRNSNAILESIERRKEALKKEKEEKKGAGVLEEEVTGEIELIEVGREKLSELMAQKADKKLRELGIQLIDVQLRRISYEKSVEQKVYERMISERQRIAQKIRSIGQGEKAKIEGRLDRDLKRIQSEAYKKSQIIRGNAQAKATAIYAKTLGLDPKFYQFIRSMEAYKKAIKEDTKFIISSDSEFLNYFKQVK